MGCGGSKNDRQPSTSGLGTQKVARGAGDHEYAVEITVAQAKDLPKMDLRNRADPYVELTIGGSKKKTKTIKGTKDPVWNQLFQWTFKTASDAKVLNIQVMDWDRFSKNDSM